MATLWKAWWLVGRVFELKQLLQVRITSSNGSKNVEAWKNRATIGYLFLVARSDSVLGKIYSDLPGLRDRPTSSVDIMEPYHLWARTQSGA